MDADERREKQKAVQKLDSQTVQWHPIACRGFEIRFF